MKRATLVLLVLLVLSVAAFSQIEVEAEDLEMNLDLDPRHSFDVDDYNEVGWLSSDRDNDGRIDYAAMVDEAGRKLLEAMDYNKDGFMDDFYYYDAGVLLREELDTNYDGRLDLWIFIEDGVYVGEYRRDTDFDGEIDLVREWGE